MTRILVSTTETQGRRDNDFCWVPDGEMVIAGTECTHGSIDDDCGCRRSLAGITTHRATTTFKVIDVPLEYEAVMENIRNALNVMGWGSPTLSLIRDRLEEDAKDLLRQVEWLPVGTVCEKRGTHIQAR